MRSFSKITPRVAGAAILLIVFAGEISASCPGVRISGNKFDEAKYYSSRADAVLEAAIGPADSELDIRDQGSERYRVFRVRVLRLYKGERDKATTIRVQVGHACEYPFQVGGQYLIYAYENDDGNLVAERNQGTKPLVQAASDLRYLRGEQPTPEDLVAYSWEEEQRRLHPEWTSKAAEVCGRVFQPSGQPVTEGVVRAWLVREDGKTVPSRIGRIHPDGTYQIELLVAGRHFFSAASETENGSVRYVGFYKENSSQEKPSTINLQPSERRCALDIVTAPQSLYSIRGIVQANDGSQLPPRGIQVQIETSPLHPFPINHFVKVQSDGTFEVQNIPPGRYSARAFLSPRNQRHWTMKWVAISASGDASPIMIPIERRNSRP